MTKIFASNCYMGPKTSPMKQDKCPDNSYNNIYRI